MPEGRIQPLEGHVSVVRVEEDHGHADLLEKHPFRAVGLGATGLSYPYGRPEPVRPSRRSAMKAVIKVLTLATLAAVLLLVPGCQEPIAKVGETVKAGPWELVVEESVTLSEFQGQPAASGKAWLVSRSVVTNTSDTTQTLEPGSIVAAASDARWQGTTTIKGLTGAQDVRAGGSANVLSAFEVPRDVTGIALKVTADEEVAKVRLN